MALIFLSRLKQVKKFDAPFFQKGELYFRSNNMSVATIIKTTANKKAEKPVVAEAAAEAPEPNLSLKVTLSLPSHPDLELTWTPLAARRGFKIKLERYDGTGGDSYKQVFVENDAIMADLLICLRVYTPTTVCLSYKDLKMVWKYQETLALVLTKEKLERNLNKHDCEDCCCDPGDHDVTDVDYRSFVEDRISAIITGPAMHGDCNRLYTEELLKGRDCPILLEPLRVGESIKLGCGHYMSREGWMGCKGNTCPMCRANQAHLGGAEYL